MNDVIEDDFLQAVTEDLARNAQSGMPIEEINRQIAEVEGFVDRLRQGVSMSALQNFALSFFDAAKRLTNPPVTHSEDTRSMRASAAERLLTLFELLTTRVTLTPFARTITGDRIIPENPRLTFGFGQLIGEREIRTFEEFVVRAVDFGEENAARLAISEIDRFESGDIASAASALLTISSPPIGMSVHADIPSNVRAVFPQGTIDFMSSAMWTAKELLSNISKSQEEIEDAERDKRTAASQKGQLVLTEAFEAAETAANKNARTWTRGVFGFAAAGLLIPAVVLSEQQGIPVGTTEMFAIILKIAVGLPLFALAAYCAHIAAQHREIERHMSILGAQLKSVRAYTADLPQEDRDKIRLLLGERAFSDPGLLLHDKGRVTAMPDDVTEIIKRAMELLASQRPDGKT